MSDLIQNSFASRVEIHNFAQIDANTSVDHNQSVELQDGLDIVSSLEQDVPNQQDTKRNEIKAIEEQSLNNVLQKLPKNLKHQQGLLNAFLSSCYSLSDCHSITNLDQKQELSKVLTNDQKATDYNQKLESAMQILNALMTNAFNHANARTQDLDLSVYLEKISSLTSADDCLLFTDHVEDLFGLFNNQIFYASFIIKAQLESVTNPELKQAAFDVSDLLLAFAGQTQLDSALAIKHKIDEHLTLIKNTSSQLNPQDQAKAQSLIQFLEDFAQRKVDYLTNIENLRHKGLANTSLISTKVQAQELADGTTKLELSHQNELTKALLAFGGHYDGQTEYFISEANRQSEQINQCFQALESRSVDLYEDSLLKVDHEPSHEALQEQGKKLEQDFFAQTANVLLQETLPIPDQSISASSAQESTQANTEPSKLTCLTYDFKVAPNVTNTVDLSWLNTKYLLDYQAQVSQNPQDPNLANTSTSANSTSTSSTEVVPKRLEVLVSDLTSIQQQRQRASTLSINLQSGLEAYIVEQFSNCPLFLDDSPLAHNFAVLKAKLDQASDLESKNQQVSACFDFILDSLCLQMCNVANADIVLSSFFASMAELNNLSADRLGNIINHLNIYDFYESPTQNLGKANSPTIERPISERAIYQSGSLGAILDASARLIQSKNQAVGLKLQEITDNLINEQTPFAQKQQLLANYQLICSTYISLGDQLDSVSEGLLTLCQKQNLQPMALSEQELTSYQDLQELKSDLESQIELLQKQTTPQTQADDQLVSLQESLVHCQEELAQLSNKFLLDVLVQGSEQQLTTLFREVLNHNVTNGLKNEQTLALAEQNAPSSGGGQNKTNVVNAEPSLASALSLINSCLAHKQLDGALGDTHQFLTNLHAQKEVYQSLLSLSHNSFFAQFIDQKECSRLLSILQADPNQYLSGFELNSKEYKNAQISLRALSNMLNAFDKLAKEPSTVNLLYLYSQLHSISSQQIEKALNLIDPKASNADLVNSLSLVKSNSHLLLLAAANNFISERNLNSLSTKALFDNSDFNAIIEQLSVQVKTSSLHSKESSKQKEVKNLIADLKSNFSKSLMFTNKATDLMNFANVNLNSFSADNVGEAIDEHFTTSHNLRRIMEGYLNHFNKEQNVDKNLTVEQLTYLFSQQVLANPNIAQLMSVSAKEDMDTSEVLINQARVVLELLDIRNLNDLAKINKFDVASFDKSMSTNDAKSLKSTLLHHEGATLGCALIILKDLLINDLETLKASSLMGDSPLEQLDQIKDSLLKNLAKPFAQKENSLLIKELFVATYGSKLNASNQQLLEVEFINQLYQDVLSNAQYRQTVGLVAPNLEQFTSLVQPLLNIDPKNYLTDNDLSKLILLEKLKSTINKQDKTIAYDQKKATSNLATINGLLDQLIGHYKALVSPKADQTLLLSEEAQKAIVSDLFKGITKDRFNLSIFAMLSKEKSFSTVDNIDYVTSKALKNFEDTIKSNLKAYQEQNYQNLSSSQKKKLVADFTNNIFSNVAKSLTYEQSGSANNLHNAISGSAQIQKDQGKFLDQIFVDSEFKELMICVFNVALENICAKTEFESVSKMLLSSEYINNNLLLKSCDIDGQPHLIRDLLLKEFSQILKQEDVAEALIRALNDNYKAQKFLRSSCLFFHQFSRIKKYFNRLSEDLKQARSIKDFSLLRDQKRLRTIDKETIMLTQSFSKLAPGSKLYMDKSLNINLFSMGMTKEDSAQASVDVGLDLSDCLEIVKNQDNSYEVILHKDLKASASATASVQFEQNTEESQAVQAQLGASAQAGASLEIGGGLGTKIKLDSDYDLSLFLSKAFNHMVQSEDLRESCLYAKAQLDFQASLKADVNVAIAVNNQDDEQVMGASGQASLELAAGAGSSYEFETNNLDISHHIHVFGSLIARSNVSVESEGVGALNQDKVALVQFNNTFNYTVEKVSKNITDLTMLSSYRVYNEEQLLGILRQYNCSEESCLALCNKFKAYFPLNVNFDNEWKHPEKTNSLLEIVKCSNYQKKGLSIEIELSQSTSDLFAFSETEDPSEQKATSNEEQSSDKSATLLDLLKDLAPNGENIQEILNQYSVKEFGKDFFSRLAAQSDTIASSGQSSDDGDVNSLKETLNSKQEQIDNVAVSVSEQLSKGEIPQELQYLATNNPGLQKILDLYQAGFVVLEGGNRIVQQGKEEFIENLKVALIDECVNFATKQAINALKTVENKAKSIFNSLLEQLLIRVTKTINTSRVIEIPLEALNNPQLIDNFNLEQNLRANVEITAEEYAQMAQRSAISHS